MENQIKELTLLLLYLNSWIEKEPYGKLHRSWKGYDFDILNLLEDEDLIRGSHRSKSAFITENGVKKAKELMKKYNIKEK